MIHDYFAQKKNYLTVIDARIKMLFIAAMITILLTSNNFYLPIIIAALAMAFLLSVRIPVYTILLRLGAPLGMAVIIMCLRIFLTGHTPLFVLNLHGIQLTGYREGLLLGLLTAGKVAGCTSLVIFLSMTTPLNMLLTAACWFKIPAAWTEIAMLTYRYIFVLLESAITIRDAQKVRLGYSSLSRAVKSSGELAGSLVIKAYDQSQATYESMKTRGFPGTGKIIRAESGFNFIDGLHAFIFVMILSLAFILRHKYAIY